MMKAVHKHSVYVLFSTVLGCNVAVKLSIMSYYNIYDLKARGK